MLSGAALAACSGGSGALAPISTPTTQAHATAAPAAAPASVKFTMHWGTAKAASRARRPQYVPATAMSVSVSVNGGTPQYLNNPNTTLTIAANAGVDTFFFQTYDEADGEGSVLSQGNITQTITAGSANFVNAVLDGVVNSVTVALDKPNAPAGAAAAVNVTVNALDADGNVIVGSGGYDRSVKLAIDDPEMSGALSLSSAVVQGPSTPITLNYNGATLDHADVSATASGVTTVIANFDPTPTAYLLDTGSISPNFITAGPNGVMYFGDGEKSTIGSIDPSGTLQTAQTLDSMLGPMVFGSDGNLWYIEDAHFRMGTAGQDITMQSSITDYPLSGNAEYVSDMIDVAGVLYFTVPNSNSIESFSENSHGTATYLTGNDSPIDALTLGSDHALYATDGTIVYRLVPPGSITQYLTVSAGIYINDIAAGPDGNIWLSGRSGNIGRFTPGSTAVSTFNVPVFNSQPLQIRACGDSLWFTDIGTGSLGRVTTSGTITEYPLPSPKAGSATVGTLACSTDGSLWVPNVYNAIARFVH